MYPTVITFVNQLVKVEITFSNQVEQLLIQFRRSDCKIGRFSLLMLAGGYTSNLFIQFRAPVSAVYVYGSSPSLTDRIEQIIDQRCKFDFNRRRRCVVNTLLLGRIRSDQLAPGKIFHTSMY